MLYKNPNYGGDSTYTYAIGLQIKDKNNNFYENNSVNPWDESLKNYTGNITSFTCYTSSDNVKRYEENNLNIVSNFIKDFTLEKQEIISYDFSYSPPKEISRNTYISTYYKTEYDGNYKSKRIYGIIQNNQNIIDGIKNLTIQIPSDAIHYHGNNRNDEENPQEKIIYGSEVNLVKYGIGNSAKYLVGKPYKIIKWAYKTKTYVRLYIYGRYSINKLSSINSKYDIRIYMDIQPNNIGGGNIHSKVISYYEYFKQMKGDISCIFDFNFTEKNGNTYVENMKITSSDIETTLKTKFNGVDTMDLLVYNNIITGIDTNNCQLKTISANYNGNISTDVGNTNAISIKQDCTGHSFGNLPNIDYFEIQFVGDSNPTQIYD